MQLYDIEDEKRLMKRQRQGRQECARQQQAARQVAKNERVDIQRLYTKQGVEGGPWMQRGVLCRPFDCQRDFAVDMTRFRASSHH